MIGVPLVAAGIAAGAAGHYTLEWAAAMLLVIGAGLAAFMLLRAGRTSVLLGFSGLALLAGLVLVAIYATGIRLGRTWLDLTDMMASHAVRFLPGLHLAFAARVIDVFDDPRRSGFTYRTLVGHPVAGDETFAVEKLADGDALVSITAVSRPNTTVGRLFRLWVRRLQKGAGRAGVARLAEISGP